MREVSAYTKQCSTEYGHQHLGGVMKKICLALLGLLILTNIGWISYVYKIEKEKQRVVEINDLLAQINETLNQKIALIESSAQGSSILFDSLDRAIKDLSVIMKKYTSFELLKYTSTPEGPTILKVRETRTRQQQYITLSPDQPPDLFRIPTSRPR